MHEIFSHEGTKKKLRHEGVAADLRGFTFFFVPSCDPSFFWIASSLRSSQ
jgi:hypothetical protein